MSYEATSKPTEISESLPVAMPEATLLRRRIVGWGVGSLLAGTAVFGAYEYVSQDADPCMATVTIGGEASTTAVPLKLPNGQEAVLSVYSSPARSNKQLPTVEVSVGKGLFGGEAVTIHRFDTPGPEMTVPFGTSNVLVNVTRDEVTTTCGKKA